MKMNSKLVGVLAVASILLLLNLSGCAVASHAVKSDFTAYNEVVQENQNQQMLLNLVRIHYHETPMFMQVGTIVNSYQSSGGGNIAYGLYNLLPFGGLIFPQSSTGLQASTSSANAGVSYNFGASPSITYTPIDGAAYQKQFLTDFSPNTFALLVKSRWPIDKLGRIMIARVVIDGSKDLVNRGEVTDSLHEWLLSLRKAQKDYHMLIKNNPVTAAASTNANAQGLTSALHANQKVDSESNAQADQGEKLKATADPKTPPAPVKEEFCIKTDKTYVQLDQISFRSLYDSMYEAAKNTETPGDRKSCASPEEVGAGIMNIHCSRFPPITASVSVWYKGYFYYIQNNDIESKDILVLLMTLYRMQASPSPTGPALTIPVG